MLLAKIVEHFGQCELQCPTSEDGHQAYGRNESYRTQYKVNNNFSLYLNLIDVKTKKSAWAAMVTDSLKGGYLSPEDIRAKLDKAATNIFKKYPGKK